jgi:hypothetical protein
MVQRTFQNNLSSAIAVVMLVLTGNSVKASDCASVYSNATRNITLIQKQQTELSYYYSRHCQKSGEVNQSSFTLGIEAVVKQIPFNFSASSVDSKSKIEEFCKTGSQQNYFSASSTDFRDEVVAASLDSFNQCIALENRGLRFTHQEQSPQSVLIFGEITQNFISASLDAVAYDPAYVTCKSTGFSSDGSAIVLDGSKSLKISKNFTLSCTRKAKNDAQKKFYPRAVIGLSTSVGPYTVELIEDQLFGFTLASQAKLNYDKAITQRDQNLNEAVGAKAVAAQLQNRLNNVSAEAFTVSYGEYDRPSTQYFSPRLYCGADIQAHANGVCGPTRTAFVKALGSYGGNNCGYGHYTFVCLSK